MVPVPEERVPEERVPEGPGRGLPVELQAPRGLPVPPTPQGRRALST